MTMSELTIKIAERDNIDYTTARAKIQETIDEIICYPSAKDEIIMAYLDVLPADMHGII